MPELEDYSEIRLGLLDNRDGTFTVVYDNTILDHTIWTHPMPLTEAEQLIAHLQAIIEKHGLKEMVVPRA